MFDSGSACNIRLYGEKKPPAYEIRNITAPVAIFWAQNDWLSQKEVSYEINYVKFLSFSSRKSGRDSSIFIQNSFESFTLFRFYWYTNSNEISNFRGKKVVTWGYKDYFFQIF